MSGYTEDPKLFKAISLGALIVYLWLLEPIPIYVTALLPLIFGVPLELISMEQLAGAYAHKFVYLFLGGFMMALAMEKWDVHKQIALRILSTVGSSKTRVLLGFIFSTGLLSMWISNTATTLMMLPMAMAIVANLEHQSKSKFPLYLLLAIAYSASIGGMGTLVGSPPNSTMAGVLSEVYGVDISFWDWMKIGLPLSILMLTILFLFFYWRLRGEHKGDKIKVDLEKKKWTKNQLKVIGVFTLVVLLWIFRKQITGINDGKFIQFGDENVAMLGTLLMFLIPAKKGEALLVWKDTKKLAWGILLLFGGGLALAKMLDINGAINAVAVLFQEFREFSLIWILLVVVAISIFGTEIMSNTAMVSVFIPVIAQFCVNNNIPLMALCMPVALAASCAFMLPAGTPPNAIVFSSGELSIAQMARTGFWLNVIGVLVVTLFSLLFIC